MAELIDDIGRVTTPTLTTQLLKGWGLRNMAVRGVTPVNPQAARFAGPAYTVRYLPLREDIPAMQQLDHPDNLLRRLVEEAPPGSVVVIDAGGRSDVGLLGDILTVRLKARGVAGVVTDGGMRDLVELRQIPFPIFCAPTPAAPPSFAALMPADVQRPVCCGGVTIVPGDVIVADADGVVVLPAALAERVAGAGFEQDRLEAYIRRRVERGEAIPGLYPPTEAVRDAYRRWVEAGEPEDL